MSWTQAYVSGLLRSADPSDEEIESALDARYGLAGDDAVLWAGPGTTLVKRDEDGNCRGYAFLACYSADGAAVVVERINGGYDNNNNDTGSTTDGTTTAGRSGGGGGELPSRLRAEVSNPKTAKEKSKKKKKGQQQDDSKHVPDIRLKNRRKAPVRKHPVITSSDGKRTNLGNKTK